MYISDQICHETSDPVRSRNNNYLKLRYRCKKSGNTKRKMWEKIKFKANCTMS